MTIINFNSILSDVIKDQPLPVDRIKEILLDHQLPYRAQLIALAYQDRLWDDCKTVIAIDGASFHLDSEDRELNSLSISPGEIDYNLFYRDGSTYKDTEKSRLLLQTLRQVFDRSTDEYQFFFDPILMKYHTYAGINNENFNRIVSQVISEYEMSDKIPHIKIQEFLNIFEKEWAAHLAKIAAQAEEEKTQQYDLVLLSSDGGTAHKVAAETLKQKLAHQKNIGIINETTELGSDPLLKCLGFPRGKTFNVIKQQAGDEELYKALNKLSNRLMVFVPDQRMDMLRQKTAQCYKIVSLNTFAHASRLAADGKHVILDVIDSGLVNGKLLKLAQHKVKYALTNIDLVAHPPAVFIRDPQGRLKEVETGLGLYFAPYPVQEIEEKDDPVFFKKKTELKGEKLSVLTFGGQGCTGKADVFLSSLMSDSYPERQERDIVILAGTGYSMTIQEALLFLEKENIVIQKMETRTLEYKGGSFNCTTVSISSRKTLHIWGQVSQTVMYMLSQTCDHFIMKPGASSTHEVIARQARGVVVIYDGSHPWEKGNLKLLCQLGASVVYETTPLDKVKQILLCQEGKKIISSDDGVGVLALSDVITEIFQKSSEEKNVEEKSSPPPETMPLPKLSTCQQLYERGIQSAVIRIFNVERGNLKKDSDRFISLKSEVTEEQLTSFFYTFIQLIKNLPTINTIETVHAVEPQLVEFLRRNEEALLLIGSNTPSLSRPSDKPIIIWTGFAAMDASIRDTTGVCNFHIPILNMLFILWEEIFCHEASLQHANEMLLAIPEECSPHLLQRHPKVKALQALIRKNSSLSPTEIARRYFGSELDDEAVELAEKMGKAVSTVFVKNFHSPFWDPRVYFSVNKLDEFNRPVLPINTISWDIEIGLLRAQLGPDNPNKIIFKEVTAAGIMRSVCLKKIELVRNNYFPDKMLQDRRSYTCGMPGLSEWLLYSAQTPRPTISVGKILHFISLWKKRKTEPSPPASSEKEVPRIDQ